MLGWQRWVQEQHFHGIYRCVVSRFGDVNYCSSGEKEELPPTPFMPTMKWASERSWEVAEREVGGCEEAGLWIDWGQRDQFFQCGSTRQPQCD